MGAVQGRPAQDHHPAVPSGVYGGSRPGSWRRSCTPGTRRCRSCAGGHRRTGLHDAGDRPLGELLQPGAVRVAHDIAWGIPIECEYRVADLACSAYPFETTRFHPLFLYESISGVLGALTLIWIGYHLRKRLRPGDLFLVFLIWYGSSGSRSNRSARTGRSMDCLSRSCVAALHRPGPAHPGLAHRPNHSTTIRRRSRRSRPGVHQDVPWTSRRCRSRRRSPDPSSPSRPTGLCALPRHPTTPSPTPDRGPDRSRRAETHRRSPHVARGPGGRRRPGRARLVGREPEAKASWLVRLLAILARLVLFGKFRFKVARRAASGCPSEAATCSWRRSTEAGWIRS